MSGKIQVNEAAIILGEVLFKKSEDPCKSPYVVSGRVLDILSKTHDWD
jgi:hypothetical protein